jgi:hypothetical protein
MNVELDFLRPRFYIAHNFNWKEAAHVIASEAKQSSGHVIWIVP